MKEGVGGTAVILATAREGGELAPASILEYGKGKSFLRQLVSTFGKAGLQSLALVDEGEVDPRIQEHNPDVRAMAVAPGKTLDVARRGVTAALEQGAEVVLIHPVDMPAVRPPTVAKLVQGLGDDEAVVPEFDGAAGLPLVLSKGAARRFLELDGAITTFEEAVQQLTPRRLATQDPGVLVHLGKSETYERILGEAPKVAPPPKKGGRPKREA